MTLNILVIIGTAFIPFLFAFIWFSEKTFGGSKWHKMADIPESKRTPIKPVKLLLSIVLNLLIAFGMFQFSVHENGVFGMVGGDAALLEVGTAAAFLAEYGGRFHTWTHGLAHGFGATLFFVLPVLGYVTIFEKKSAAYFFVYLGYWWVSLTLMSIVLSIWGANLTPS